MTTTRSAALTLLLLLANSCPFTWASPAFKEWGQINLYLPPDATDDEKKIAKIAAAGKPTEALAETVKAIKIKKDAARLLLMKIELSERLLQEENVRADFQQLLPLPMSQASLFHAVDLADHLDEIEIGTKLGDRYQKEYRTASPIPILLNARMNSKLKHYSRAEQLLLPILNNPSMRSFTYPELARVYVYWNKPEKLIAMTNTGLSNPTWFTEKTKVTLLTLRANAYLETGKYKEALADYNLLIAKAPSLPALYTLRAKALTALGENKRAEADRLTQKRLDAADK